MLVVLAGGLFAFIYFFERHIQPPSPAVTRVLPNLNPDEVTRIEIQPRDQFLIRVDRVNGAWQLTKPIVYPVRAAAVEGFLKFLAELSPQRRISPAELQNNKKTGSDFGFDKPLTTVSVQQGDDQRRLELGDATGPRDGIYARAVGLTGGIDVISASAVENFPTNAGRWRDTAFASLQGLPFTELTVSGAGGQLKFQRDEPGKPWSMILPIRARANNELINRLLGQLQTLSVRQFVRDDTNADLEPYGLEPAQLALAFKDKNTNQLLSLQFGKSPTNDAGLTYARANSSSSIVLIPGADLKSWGGEYWQFRDPHLFSLTISEQPGAIECYGPDGRTNFIARMADGNLTVIDSQGQHFPAERNIVDGYIKYLVEMPVAMWDANRFANDAVADSTLPDLGLAPNPVRRYVLRAASPSGDGRILAQIDFGLPNTNNPGTICARRSDLADEHSVFAVNVADFNRLPSAAAQLRRHRVWDFDATNVTRLKIQTNGPAHEWEHRRENAWVPLTSGFSDDGAAGIYMENLVNNLGLLEAAAWVGPGEPTEEYGFNTNSLKISVTLTRGSESTNLSVTFGNAVPGAGKAHFASTHMEDGKNWIFAITGRDWSEITNYLPAAN